MMAERGDFTMMHEPFSYLAEFGQAEVAGERVTSAAGLISVLISLAQDGRVFAKETTGRHYPEVLADRRFLAAGARHTFLIRHPRETIASCRALDPGAGLHKIGFESQYAIFAEVCRLTCRVPVAVDSGDLITRPAAIIRAYCVQAGMDFRPGALTWQPSDRPEWQPSRRWHADAAASTGFARKAAGASPTPPDQWTVTQAGRAEVYVLSTPRAVRKFVVQGGRSAFGSAFTAGRACPVKVRATMRAVLAQVAAAPPKRFAGGGYWEAMKGDMTGWFEVRVDGPRRHHYRLFCRLDYDAKAQPKAVAGRYLRAG